MKSNGVGLETDAPGRVRIRGPFTQEELAALFGCTRSNIHVIEKRALQKLRAAAAEVAEVAEVCGIQERRKG